MMQLKIFRLIVILFTVLFINKASIAQIIGIIAASKPVTGMILIHGSAMMEVHGWQL